jgi:ribonuclease P protein component
MYRGRSLRKNSQFDTVYSQGKTWAGDLIVLKVLPNGLDWNRYGFVAGKRLGKAVIRNRVKRLLREVVRATPMSQGWDAVFIARAGAATADYHQLNEAVGRVLRRARILTDSDLYGEIGKAEG